MDTTKFDGIVFVDTWQDFNSLRYAGRVIHILCRKGNMGFTFQDTHYNISDGDYVILPNATLAFDFSASDDFQGIMMNLSEAFVASIAIRSNYGIIGHLSRQLPETLSSTLWAQDNGCRYNIRQMLNAHSSSTSD